MWRFLRVAVFAGSLLGCVGAVVLWGRTSLTAELVGYGGIRSHYVACSSWGVLEFSSIEDEINVELIRRGQGDACEALGFFRWRETLPPRRWFPPWRESFSWELESVVLADGEPFTRVCVNFPHWLLLVAFAPGILWLPLHWRRQRRRRRRGRCEVCGYDLRGSPQQCPECGTPRKACG